MENQGLDGIEKEITKFITQRLNGDGLLKVYTKNFGFDRSPKPLLQFQIFEREEKREIPTGELRWFLERR